MPFLVARSLLVGVLPVFLQAVRAQEEARCHLVHFPGLDQVAVSPPPRLSGVTRSLPTAPGAARDAFHRGSSLHPCRPAEHEATGEATGPSEGYPLTP